jgi:hypothetical protein
MIDDISVLDTTVKTTSVFSKAFPGFNLIDPLEGTETATRGTCRSG